MRRRLLPFLSTLSLILCATACAFWIRSYRRADYLLLRPSQVRAFSAISDNGAAQWKMVRYLQPSPFGDQKGSGIDLASIPLSDTEADAGAPTYGLPADPLTHENVTWVSFIVLRRFSAGSDTGAYADPRAGPAAPDYHYAYFVAPYWSLVLLLAILPTARIVGRRRAATNVDA